MEGMGSHRQGGADIRFPTSLGGCVALGGFSGSRPQAFGRPPSPNARDPKPICPLGVALAWARLNLWVDAGAQVKLAHMGLASSCQVTPRPSLGPSLC